MATATKGKANAKTRVAAPRQAKGATTRTAKPKSTSSVQASARTVQRRRVSKARAPRKQSNDTSVTFTRAGRPLKAPHELKVADITADEKLSTKDLAIVIVFLVVIFSVGCVIGAIVS